IRRAIPEARHRRADQAPDHDALERRLALSCRRREASDCRRDDGLGASGGCVIQKATNMKAFEDTISARIKGKARLDQLEAEAKNGRAVRDLKIAHESDMAEY